MNAIQWPQWQPSAYSYVHNYELIYYTLRYTIKAIKVRKAKHTVQLGSTYVFHFFLRQRLPTSGNYESQEPIMGSCKIKPCSIDLKITRQK